MSIFSHQSLRQWVKTSPHPLARFLFRTAKAIRTIDLPAPKSVFIIVDRLFLLTQGTISATLRIFLWTPVFKSRTVKTGKRLYLYGGVPFTSGPLAIRIGDDCRISGKTTITGRSVAQETPELTLGDNIDLGWMTTIAVGNKISIGNNVRIAGQCFLAGYPGHPLDPRARALGEPEKDEQVGHIILEDDVWLATSVSVMAGVTIGQGTIVAAGSVVTRDLPPNVIAAGIPAKVVREL